MQSQIEMVKRRVEIGECPANYFLCTELLSRIVLSPVCSPMRRQERRRKFHEAVVNFLYPTPPPRDEEEEDEDPQCFLPAELKGDSFPDDSRDSGSSSSSDNDGEAGGGERKLTRAQRKRIRKKRLREESARRGKMIGPLLSSVNDDGSSNVQKEETSVVQPNSNVQPNSKVDSASYEHQGDAAASTKQRRLKHRRMVKRLAKDSEASIIEQDRR